MQKTKEPTIEEIITHIRSHEYMALFNKTNSRERTKSEIYTPTKLVQEMLDTIPQHNYMDKTKTFIDQSCGDGQLLCEILIRKIINGSTLFDALSTIYGVELQQDAVEMCKERLLCGHEEYRDIVDNNIVCADALTYDYSFGKEQQFDIIAGNPPYNGLAALHQQFFNKAVDLVNDDGYVVFVQPATPYQNKKHKKKKAEQEMIDNVVKYSSKVRIHPGTVFEAAAVGTDVAITTLQKIKSIPAINEIMYKNGDTHEKVKLEHISITEFSPELYANVVAKFKEICKVNGSVGDNITKKTQVNSAFLSKVRGNVGTDNFFTIVPRKDGRTHYISAKSKGFGVVIPVEHVENFYDYCESFVARTGLALIKINVKMECGELNLVPMCDFSRTYTDDELYQMVGLTEEEINAIENFLPDYYGRKA